ncbi:MAG: nucleotidyltransferase domain-containing protein [Bacteroidota bacterium]|nr:nucleotidyltransferase domain-containing protein [Bacteroidota bacterium]
MNQTIINKLTKYFNNQPIEKAWIFGSYARSEETVRSDIDILVNFSPNEKITLLKYIHIINDLTSLTGRKIDLVEEGQLMQYAQNSADRDKILIYERETTGQR